MTDLDAQIAAAKAAIARRKHTDVVATVWAVVLCVTVLVPWLIGRWVLRGALFRPTSPDVYDQTIRSDGAYFLSDWSTGCAAVLALLVAFLLLRSWERRAGAVTLAFLLAASGVPLLCVGSAHSWNAAERQSARLLRTTPYPWSDHWYTCGYQSRTLDGDLWQVQTARSTDRTGAGCNRVVIFDGWNRIGEVDMPKGMTVNVDKTVISRGGVAKVAADGGGVGLRFRVQDPDKALRR